MHNVSLEMQTVSSVLVKSDDWDRRADGTMEIDRRQVDSGQARSSCTVNAQPLPFAGARVHRERIRKQDVEFGAIVGCPGCNATKDKNRAQAHSGRCRVRVEECLRVTPQGVDKMDRRSEITNEA